METDNYTLYYYKISLLRSSAPILTYASKSKIANGTLVNIPLKQTIKNAVVVNEVEKPEFKTVEVVSVSVIMLVIIIAIPKAVKIIKKKKE